MNDVLTPDSPVLFLFLYLLPGFLGLSVYGYLAEGAPQDKFSQVVTAFVLSLVAGIIVHFITGLPLLPSLPVTSNTPLNAVLQALIGRDLLYSAITASVIGGVVAALNNYGLIDKAAHQLGLTFKGSNADVWQDVFVRNPGIWLRLEFTDGRALVGWPKYFSKTGAPRELFIADATWTVTDKNGAVVSADVAGPGVYIGDFSVITSVEILKGDWSVMSYHSPRSTLVWASDFMAQSDRFAIRLQAILL